MRGECKLKTKKRYYIIVFMIMILITVMVFLSDRVYFFKYDTSVEKSKFIIEKNSKSETDNELLWFTYNDSNIMLNVNSGNL